MVAGKRSIWRCGTLCPADLHGDHACLDHVQIEAVSFSGLDSVGGSLQGSKEEQQLQTELRRVYMHPTDRSVIFTCCCRASEIDLLPVYSDMLVVGVGIKLAQLGSARE